MKKAIIYALLMVLVLTACTAEQSPRKSAERTTAHKPAETPTPEITATRAPTDSPPPKPAEIAYKEVSIDGGLITMQIPDTFITEENYTGSLFFAYGEIPDAEGNSIYSHISITRLFQAEEPNMTYEIMDKTVDTMMILPQGQDIKVTRIGNVQIPDNANGYRARCELFDGSVFNYLNLKGEGEYYSIKIYAERASVSEDYIQKIFDSIKIDSDTEAQSVESFEVNLDGMTYYSSKLDGASIEVPDNWQPAESYVFAYDNLVMGLVSEDNKGFIVIKKYDKEIQGIDDFTFFYTVMVTEVANRGHVAADEIANIESYLHNSGRLFIVYPSKLFIAQFLLEYEDAFYCAEAYYMGDEQEEVNKIIETLASFVAPGKEIIQE